MALPGFPIRKSADLSRMCRSPQLIAACHVLRRLLMPRHSPCALSSLTFLSIDYRLLTVTIVVFASRSIYRTPRHLFVIYQHLSPTDLVWFSYFRIMQAFFRSFLKLRRLRFHGDALPYFKKFHNFCMMFTAFVNSAPVSRTREFTPSSASNQPLITIRY